MTESYCWEIGIDIIILKEGNAHVWIIGDGYKDLTFGPYKILSFTENKQYQDLESRLNSSKIK